MVMLLTNVTTYTCRSIYKKAVTLPDINKNQNFGSHSKYTFSGKSIVEGRDLPCGQTDSSADKQI